MLPTLHSHCYILKPSILPLIKSKLKRLKENLRVWFYQICAVLNLLELDPSDHIKEISFKLRSKNKEIRSIKKCFLNYFVRELGSQNTTAKSKA